LKSEDICQGKTSKREQLWSVLENALEQRNELSMATLEAPPFLVGSHASAFTSCGSSWFDTTFVSGGFACGKASSFAAGPWVCFCTPGPAVSRHETDETRATWLQLRDLLQECGAKDEALATAWDFDLGTMPSPLCQILTLPDCTRQRKSWGLPSSLETGWVASKHSFLFGWN
jgi:hypothetical protein